MQKAGTLEYYRLEWLFLNFYFSHHIEDYLTAIKQILGGPNEPEWDLGLDRDFSNTNILSRVPDNIKTFYDVVLTNPGKQILVNLTKERVQT